MLEKHCPYHVAIQKKHDAKKHELDDWITENVTGAWWAIGFSGTVNMGIGGPGGLMIEKCDGPGWIIFFESVSEATAFKLKFGDDDE